MPKTNNLTPFTFESSGESCFIRPVPVMLVREVERSIPRPEPPVQAVENPDGTTRNERNLTHPDYLAALRVRNDKVQEVITKLVIRRGVFVRLTDEQREEVRELREDLKAINDVELNEPDEAVWVKYIACASHNDLTRLINEVSNRSVPTDPKSASGSTSSPSPFEATTSSENPLAEAV
jgi:hypothetical protein